MQASIPYHIAQQRRILLTAAREATTPDELRAIAVALDNLTEAAQLVPTVMVLERGDGGIPTRVSVVSGRGIFVATLDPSGDCSCGRTAHVYRRACAHRLAGRLVVLLQQDAAQLARAAQRRADLAAACDAERAAGEETTRRRMALQEAMLAEAAARQQRIALEQRVWRDEALAAEREACLEALATEREAAA